MRFFCFNPQGFEGGLVRVEVDIRRGLPAIDIVGLAGAAVRESKERVRIALRNAGIEFPLGHVLINLSPAGTPKVGAAFDLAIALAIAHAWSRDHGKAGDAPNAALANQTGSDPAEKILVMGELTLGGDILAVEAVVPALLSARRAGITLALVPGNNRVEAAMLNTGGLFLASTLPEALLALTGPGRQTLVSRTSLLLESDSSQGEMLNEAAPGKLGVAAGKGSKMGCGGQFDTSIFGDNPRLLLGLMAAAAGHHHLLLYGPPGAGKTMALRFLGSLLPPLDEERMLEVNRLYSLAGLLSGAQGLVSEAPVRMPHHGSSPEALMGGGKRGLPGEISLAHHGLLVLDEAPEFRSSVLQALREPMEEGVIRLGRANGALWFPAAFILGLSLNPCPCGRLGSGRGSCGCSGQEIQRYWGRIGAPVIDRIDIRLPLGLIRQHPPLDDFYRECPVTVDWRHPAEIRQLVKQARSLGIANGLLHGSQIESACRFTSAARDLLEHQVAGHGWLARSRHGVMRLARTIAQLGGSHEINEVALAAAISLRGPIEALPGLTLAG